nr:basic helix-loop-helix transcription factor [Loropetalum chinense var. rubrum]
MMNICVPEMTTFQHTQAEVLAAREIQNYYINGGLTDISPSTFIDHQLFNNNHQLLSYPRNYTTLDHLLPYFTSPNISHEIFPLLEHNFDSYSYPKRQKCYENIDQFYSGFLPNNCFEGFFPSEIQIPEVNFSGGGDNGRKSSEVLSGQSLAARLRRRKITEKTKELGKLIPGGIKMNTADMLQYAFKYVKYLQAQVGILDFMGSFQERKGTTHIEELQVLLGSSAVQEKLCLEEKCLVPKEFVKILRNHLDFKSKPLVSNGLNHLIQLED